MLELLLVAAIVGESLSTPGSIRAVDFENSSFALWECEAGQECAIVELVDGEGSLAAPYDPTIILRAYLGFVRYGDVTGDGHEEALVRLGSSAGGTGQFSQLLVFSDSGGKLRVVHRFPTGDRAHGGYLDACVQNRRLVVVREYSETCMVCLEAFETSEYSWTPQGPELVARHLEPNPSSGQACDLCEYTTVCGNRPFDWMACC